MDTRTVANYIPPIWGVYRSLERPNSRAATRRLRQRLRAEARALGGLIVCAQCHEARPPDRIAVMREDGSRICYLCDRGL
jgi:hypothetical protein